MGSKIIRAIYVTPVTPYVVFEEWQRSIPKISLISKSSSKARRTVAPILKSCDGQMGFCARGVAGRNTGE